jgi:hypothetical protein
MSRRFEAPLLTNTEGMAALSRSDRQKVLILLRRMRFLRSRFETIGPQRGHDVMEYNALHWALEMVGVVRLPPGMQ